jgi:hypothetical protein
MVPKVAIQFMEWYSQEAVPEPLERAILLLLTFHLLAALAVAVLEMLEELDIREVHQQFLIQERLQLRLLQ